MSGISIIFSIGSYRGFGVSRENRDFSDGMGLRINIGWLSIIRLYPDFEGYYERMKETKP